MPCCVEELCRTRLCRTRLCRTELCPTKPCCAVPAHVVLTGPSRLFWEVRCFPRQPHCREPQGKWGALTPTPNPVPPPRWPLAPQGPLGAGGRVLSLAGVLGWPVGTLPGATYGAMPGVTAACTPSPCHVHFICAESWCQRRAAPCSRGRHVTPGPPSQSGCPHGWSSLLLGHHCTPAWGVREGVGCCLPPWVRQPQGPVGLVPSQPLRPPCCDGDRRGWGKQWTPATVCWPWAQGGTPQNPCAAQSHPAFPKCLDPLPWIPVPP